MHTKKKIISILLAAMLLLFAYGVYSRPQSTAQLYPLLPLNQCTEIRGYYAQGTTLSITEFTIRPNDEAFAKLCALFTDQSYRRSLKDILPQSKYPHRVQPEDFQWAISFYFEDINLTLPDGIYSNMMLHFQYWYGDLELRSYNGTYSCFVEEQEIWAKEVLDTITKSLKKSTP